MQKAAILLALAAALIAAAAPGARVGEASECV